MGIVFGYYNSNLAKKMKKSRYVLAKLAKGNPSLVQA